MSSDALGELEESHPLVLQLLLQEVVSCLMRMLGTELRSPGRAESIHKQRDMYPASIPLPKPLS